MSSNLACIGLPVTGSDELRQVLDRVRPALRPAGTFGGVQVWRWADTSGATLILGVRDGELVDLLPTYVSSPGATFEHCQLLNESVASAAVVDDAGEQLTSMAFEPEQHRQLVEFGRPVGGRAGITALAQSVRVHADADAFSASPDSLLDPAGDPGAPPPEYVERGWSWPPRIATESFISHGVFGDPADSTARARLSGVVLSGRRRTCALTGEDFSVARVRTVGFEADVCLAAAEHPVTPVPGNVVSGTVFLVARVETSDLP